MPESSSLSRPLLPGASPDTMATSSTTTTTAFPNDIARHVLLHIPSEYHHKKSNQPSLGSSLCYIQYQADTGLLQVIQHVPSPPSSTRLPPNDHDDDEESLVVLDVLDPDDLIGARLVIEESPHTEQEEEEHNTINTATNEPSSSVLRNRHGQATLHLYCYPRRNPQQQTTSWMQWCGLSSRSTSVPVNTPNPHQTHKVVPPTTESPHWPRVAHFRAWSVAPVEDLGHVQTLLQALQEVAHPHQQAHQTERNVLVLINPVSGAKRNASTIYETYVKPMVGVQSGTVRHLHVCRTTHAGHAQERMAVRDTPTTTTSDSNDNDDDTDPGWDISRYQAIVVMGGDGLLFEVLNGLVARPDAHDLLLTNQNHLTVGVVGCGTSNGMATSLTHASHEPYGPLTETFLIAKGHETLMDVSRYETMTSTTTTTTTKSYISFLTYAYAMIADIDIESEVLRWLGELRNDVWAVWRVLWLRHYPATFHYLPVNSTSRGAGMVPVSSLPPLSQPLENSTTDQDKDGPEWVTIQGDFYLLWVSHVSHAAMHTHQAPGQSLNQGAFQVMMVRKQGGTAISKWRMAWILLGLETGRHVDMSPWVELVQCTALRLEPLGGQRRVGRNVVDGELVEPGPIQGVVVPGLIHVYAGPAASVQAPLRTRTVPTVL